MFVSRQRKEKHVRCVQFFIFRQSRALSSTPAIRSYPSSSSYLSLEEQPRNNPPVGGGLEKALLVPRGWRKDDLKQEKEARYKRDAV